MVRNVMKHTIHKWGGDISSIHEVIGPQYTQYTSIPQFFNWVKNKTNPGRWKSARIGNFQKGIHQLEASWGGCFRMATASSTSRSEFVVGGKYRLVRFQQSFYIPNWFHTDPVSERLGRGALGTSTWGLTSQTGKRWRLNWSPAKPGILSCCMRASFTKFYRHDHFAQ